MIKMPTSLRLFFATLFFYLLSFSYGFAKSKRMCPTLNDYIKEGTSNGATGADDHCLLCGIYKIITDACADIANFSWNTFAVPLQGVVAVAASIYIAVYTLKNIGNFSQQDPTAYLSNDKTGIIPLCVKVAAVIWLLGNQSFVYSNIICPVIATGMAIGREITGGTLSGFGGASDVSALFDMVINNVREFNDSLYEIVAFGRLLLCVAFLPDGILDWHFHLIPFGAVLYVFGWFLLIGSGFYLLDVIFRLAVGCMLLPMAIACGVSKLTSTYTRKTWNLFVNVFFNFVMLGMILEFIKDMILEAMSGSGDLRALLSKPTPITDSDAKDIAEKIEISSFLLTTICCMVSFKLFMEIESITDTVSSSSSVGKLGQKAGAITAQVVKWPASKVTKGALGFANTARLETGRRISEGKPATWLRTKGRNIKSRVKRWVGL